MSVSEGVVLVVLGVTFSDEGYAVYLDNWYSSPDMFLTTEGEKMQLGL
jgi:hypothetical protein